MIRSFFSFAIAALVLVLGGCVHNPYYRGGGYIQYGEVYTPPNGYVHGLRGQWTDPVIVRHRNGSYMLMCWPGSRNKPADRRGECHD